MTMAGFSEQAADLFRHAVTITATLTLTPTGGGYGGHGGSVEVTTTDPDVTFPPTAVSINENVPGGTDTDTVTVTVTRATPGAAALALTLAEGDDPNGAITSVAWDARDAAGIPAKKKSADLRIVIQASSNIAGTSDSKVQVTITPTGGRGLPTEGITVTVVNDDASSG